MWVVLSIVLLVIPVAGRAQEKHERTFGSWKGTYTSDLMTDERSRGSALSASRVPLGGAILSVSCPSDSGDRTVALATVLEGDSASTVRVRFDERPVGPVEQWVFQDRGPAHLFVAPTSTVQSFVARAKAGERVVVQLSRASYDGSPKAFLFNLDGITAALRWIGCP